MVKVSKTPISHFGKGPTMFGCCRYCIWSTLDLHGTPWKFQEILTFQQGTVGTWRLTLYNLFRHWSTRSAFLGQIDQNAPGQSWVDQNSKLVKITQNNTFHVFTSNPSLSNIFVNFNQLWPKVDSRERSKT